MHLGNMSTIGHQSQANFKHIIINNGAHDSVGGQPTDAVDMDNFRVTQVALGLGYKQVFFVAFGCYVLYFADKNCSILRRE